MNNTRENVRPVDDDEILVPVLVFERPAPYPAPAPLALSVWIALAVELVGFAAALFLALVVRDAFMTCVLAVGSLSFGFSVGLVMGRRFS